MLTLNYKVLSMENKEQYLNDLREIKDIMNRSSRFISLSGLSGVAAGIYALIGAFFAYRIIYATQAYGNRVVAYTSTQTLQLLGVGLAVLVMAIATGILLTTRTARKNKETIWNQQARLLLANLAIPLATGGLLCLVLMYHGLMYLVAPLTLIFYGLALINASKYTLSDIRGLGLCQVAIGLAAAFFIGHGLLFWAVGFGVMHIVYGLIMKLKYGS